MTESRAIASESAAAVDLAAMRAQYRTDGIAEADFPEEPFQQFARWFEQAAAEAADPAGVLAEPNAMIVSTVDGEGRPSSRTVLLKGVDERGFVFFTNYESRKARDIAGNAHVSLLFPWHPMGRQVIVTGTAERTGREETVRYFRSRPHGSQLGAWASAQSSVIASRDELDAAYAELAARYPEGEQVPAPPHWGGFRVLPDTVEFWQGRTNRLHDRLRYTREASTWTLHRLSP
ncbi:pyridoxine/pyridoxamine 5'-phosphate oxidase [Streptomyces spectabilis]|uniref:Pyridoxine/pyridoxamine 5'-phosphate oxidase n=2 Tax=Streptomyces spectabilis TaxID=68270 RepID=A0A7W8B0Z7_STRST|nr:pyridoxamine 5'-phosphate oxidase [Streptomyces spectabilis]GGV43421.1 pyridoxine/pyridoxamine 5'-phosphate oxidase [Streptomyces spectabilis]